MKHLTLLSFAVFTAYIATAQNSQVPKQEKKVMQLVASLPEVMKANRYIIKHSHGKRQLTTEIESEPSAEHPYYHLSVSEFNGSTLVSHFHFLVDAKTYEIRYWAVGEDKVLSLSNWRKRHYRDY
jgi:hypothetical protein